ALSDCPSDCESNSGNFENDTVSEDSESNIRPPNFQKKDSIVSDSNDELEEEWNEHDITPNLLINYLNIPGANIELGDAPTISELDFILIQDNKGNAMPEQYQLMEHHKELASTTAYKHIQNTLKKRGQTRRICIKLPTDILKLYQDEEENMIFKNNVSEKVSIETPATS
ncbi:hypothetical protein M0804_014894, partial [Polistes exclamans]